MKISKEARKLSRSLFRASFTDGHLDRTKVSGIVQETIQAKPRHYIDVLKDYQRLLRLELDRRHAVIESASQLDVSTSVQIVRDLKTRYGQDITTEFKVNPELIGGLRIKLGSDVWDGSVRGRLNTLQDELNHA